MLLHQEWNSLFKSHTCSENDDWKLAKSVYTWDVGTS